MPYVLLDLSSDDQEKIINSTSGDICQRLTYLQKEGTFPKSWAFNHESKNYMFSWPETVKADNCNMGFMIVLEGRWYKFCLENMFDHRLFILDESRLSSTEVARIEREISDAFNVYGLFGGGPLDADGRPDNKVTPVFKKRG